MARPEGIESPPLCLEAAEAILPNLARGSATGVLSASWGNSVQRTFSSFFAFFFAFAASFRHLRYVFVTGARSRPGRGTFAQKLRGLVGVLVIP
jgi:hypothetical protein